MITPRRERKREAALAEIKQHACAMLSTVGLDALSLRGLAIHLGMAPSGIHYYFSTRDDLLFSLIVDAFEELAARVAEAAMSGHPEGSIGAWRSGMRAYYWWALANPDRFELAHSRIATRLKARPGLLDAKDRVVRALMGPLLLALESRVLVAPDVTADLDPRLLTHLEDWRRAINATATPMHQLAGLHAYTLIHGHVLLVLTGSLPRELLEDDTLLEAQLLLLVRRFAAP